MRKQWSIQFYKHRIDPNNEIDEDLEIQAGIVRSAKEDTGVPSPHTPVLTNEEYSAQGKKNEK